MTSHENHQAWDPGSAPEGPPALESDPRIDAAGRDAGPEIEVEPDPAGSSAGSEAALTGTGGGGAPDPAGSDDEPASSDDEPASSDDEPASSDDGPASSDDETVSSDEELETVDASWVHMVVSRLEDVERTAEEFHRRSAHRESIIDRLHDENRELRAGETRLVLEPIIADLVRLLDALSKEAIRIEPRADGAEPAAVLRSFASDVELILDRCGVEIFTAEPGAPYLRGEHRPVGVVVTEEPDRHNTIATIVGVGLRDRMGNVRRPVQARFYSCADMTPRTD